MNKIHTVGRYMIEVWKAAGMDMQNVKVGLPATGGSRCQLAHLTVWPACDFVQFLWASEQITAFSDEYWRRVMDIATKNTVTRMQRCCTIMGRTVRGPPRAPPLAAPWLQRSPRVYDVAQCGHAWLCGCLPCRRPTPCQRPRSCTPPCSAQMSSSSRYALHLRAQPRFPCPQRDMPPRLHWVAPHTHRPTSASLAWTSGR